MLWIHGVSLDLGQHAHEHAIGRVVDATLLVDPKSACIQPLVVVRT